MEKEKYWSRFANDFDAKQLYVTGKELSEDVFSEIEKLQNLGHLLEFACGNGAYTKVISKFADKVIATDYSQAMVEQVKKIFSDNRKITVEQANCHNTRYPNQAFNSVFMAHLIHIINNPENVLSKSHRLLKPNGNLIITSFSTDKMKLIDKIALLNRYKKTFGRLSNSRTDFTLNLLIKLVEQKGFKIEIAKLLGTKTKAIFIKATKN